MGVFFLKTNEQDKNKDDHAGWSLCSQKQVRYWRMLLSFNVQAELHDGQILHFGQHNNLPIEEQGPSDGIKFFSPLACQESLMN